MKAAVIHEHGGPEVLRYEDVPDPNCPDDGLLVEVGAVSIEGGDVLTRQQGAIVAFPHVVGYQCAGTVVEVGSAVTDRAVGDRVVTVNVDGSHAALRAVPAMFSWPVPEGLDLVEAACIPVAFGTAHECLFEAGGLEAGQTVLVQAGGGGVGVAALQMAKAAGATVLTTASSAEKAARLTAFGADRGIDTSAEDFVALAKEATGGRGVDVVLDSVGGDTLARGIHALAYGGTLVSVGAAGRNGTDLVAQDLWPNNLTLRGVLLATSMFFEHPRVHPMVASCIERVASGELRVEVDRTFPLAEAAAAHAYIESRAAVGRVVLVP